MSQLGKYGESLATSILIDKGYAIIEKNYRYGHGEIDIVAEIENTIVFVEVKTRKNKNFGEPEESVTQAKQKQLIKIANSFLYEKRITNKDCRFDVIAILLEGDNKPVINHIENAF